MRLNAPSLLAAPPDRSFVSIDSRPHNVRIRVRELIHQYTVLYHSIVKLSVTIRRKRGHPNGPSSTASSNSTIRDLANISGHIATTVSVESNQGKPSIECSWLIAEASNLALSQSACQIRLVGVMAKATRHPSRRPTLPQPGMAAGLNPLANLASRPTTPLHDQVIDSCRLGTTSSNLTRSKAALALLIAMALAQALRVPTTQSRMSNSSNRVTTLVRHWHPRSHARALVAGKSLASRVVSKD